MKRIMMLWSVLLMGVLGCHREDGGELPASVDARPSVSADGRAIDFPNGAPGLKAIRSEEMRKGEALMSVIAPARIVASVGPSRLGDGNTVLFESPDVTTLYSQYQQSKANAERTSKNLARVRDMFNNQTLEISGSTEKNSSLCYDNRTTPWYRSQI